MAHRLRRHPHKRHAAAAQDEDSKSDDLSAVASMSTIATLPKQEGLGDEQVLAARAVFAAADADGSGTLERGEMRHMFAELGLVLTKKQMQEYVDSAAVLADHDAE